MVIWVISPIPVHLSSLIPRMLMFTRAISCLTTCNLQSWIFIGRTDVAAKTPILWPLDAKNWPIGKDPDAGKFEGKRRQGWQDEMVGWHHWQHGHEIEQALGVGDGQGSLACWSLWGHKESNTIEWLNWIELNLTRSNTKRDLQLGKFYKDGRRMWWRKKQSEVKMKSQNGFGIKL